MEFVFKNCHYSITNYLDGNIGAYWQFDNNTEKISMKICKFNQNSILIDFIKNLIIEDVLLKDIFDKYLYTDLYVL